jgi:cytochrome oxidase assembly protein ShyY1
VLKFLLKPKWVALTLVAILLQPAFFALSDWQWRRLHQRETYNTVILDNQNKPTVSLDDAIAQTPKGLRLSVDPAWQWRPVSVTGTWDVAHQVLVRKKSYESNLGFWVVTPITDAHHHSILVNRGWIPASSSALTSPAVLPAPTGNVSIIGRLRIITARDKPRPKDLPHGQVDTIQPSEVLPASSVVSNGYLELSASTPQSMTSDLSPIQPPEITEGPHRSYALQWIFFAIMTVIGYIILIRKEIQDNMLA